MSRDELRVDVERRSPSDGRPHTDRFGVRLAEVVTVADVLDAINAEPRTLAGELVAPIAWSGSCSFPVCGSCAMSINGRAGLACGTRADAVMGKKRHIRLAALDGFSVLADLWVDMAPMRERAARLSAWIDPGVELVRTADDPFERCTECGVCVAACPEAGLQRSFVGPAALAASHRVQRLQPVAAEDRVAHMLAPGGIDDCGRADNCVEVCPEAIPIDQALGNAARAATKLWIARILGRRR
jgi:succinate dehydrogenase / fumarate reductase iron-sulfur subunit